MNRRTALTRIGIGAGLLLTGLPSILQAQQSSRQAPHIIVAYPAGGVADFAARSVADGLHTTAGLPPPIVENKTGAAGNIALDYLVRQSRNINAVAVFSNSLLTTNPFVPQLASATIDPLKELVPVAAIADMVLMLAASSHLGVNSLDEFLKEARSRSGSKPLRIGLAGLGTPHHLSALLLEREADLDLTLVPYRGGAPMIADAAGGHLDAVFTTIPVGGPMVQAGKMNWIAVVQDTKVPSLPSIPSLIDIFGGATIPSWIGIFARADAPDDMVQELHDAITTAVNSPDITEKLRDNGLEPLNLSLDETRQLLESEAIFMSRFLSEFKLDFSA